MDYVTVMQTEFDDPICGVLMQRKEHRVTRVYIILATFYSTWINMPFKEVKNFVL